MRKSGMLYKVGDEIQDDSKNIVIISSEFPPGPGGIGKHAYDLARALAWKDYDITVFTSQDYSQENEINQFRKSLPANIKLVRLIRSGWMTYLHRWTLIRQFLNDNPVELLIVSGRFPLWMGYLAKKKFGKSFPVHAFIHGSELSRKNEIHRIFTTRALATVDCIWAVSNYTRKLLYQVTKREDIRVLPNGLWFSDWPSEKQHLHHVELEGEPSLLTVGRISPRKGQHLLVKALPVLRSIYPDVHYHLVGIPTGQEILKGLVNNLQVSNAITFHGKVAKMIDLAAYYMHASVFVMLSETQADGDTEGFGIAILEANYFGKPAIGAKDCGIEDAIMDGYNGRLVDGSNPIEIAEALKDIMDNYSAYSARARKWALRHDWKLLIEHFSKVEDVPVLTNIKYEV